MDFDNITQESLNGAIVRKHNDLIEAKYQLPNLQEQRVIFVLLGQIKSSDEDFKYYRITVSDFAEILGVRVDRMYEELERTLKNLMSRLIHIKSDAESFLIMHWLSSAEYKRSSGYIELAFDPKLKPYLLQLKKHFTEYKLDTILHLKSIYAIRLYELLKKESFKAKNNQFRVYFEYTDLREKFGIEKKEYLKFNNFKQKAIDPAVKELSEKTDLIINEVKYGKTGRKITNITFIVLIRSEEDISQQQAKLELIPEKPKEESHPIIEKMLNLGFSEEIAKRYKNKYGVKQLERNIAYTLAKKQEGLVKDIPSYLNKAIEDDLGGAWDIKRQKEAEKKQKQVEAAKVEEKAKQALQAQYDQALAHFVALPEEQQMLIKMEFMNHTDAIVVTKMKELENKGQRFFDSMMVSSNFKIFLVKQKGF